MDINFLFNINDYIIEYYSYRQFKLINTICRIDVDKCKRLRRELCEKVKVREDNHTTFILINKVTSSSINLQFSDGYLYIAIDGVNREW